MVGVKRALFALRLAGKLLELQVDLPGLAPSFIDATRTIDHETGPAAFLFRRHLSGDSCRGFLAGKARLRLQPLNLLVWLAPGYDDPVEAPFDAGFVDERRFHNDYGGRVFTTSLLCEFLLPGDNPRVHDGIQSQALRGIGKHNPAEEFAVDFSGGVQHSFAKLPDDFIESRSGLPQHLVADAIGVNDLCAQRGEGCGNGTLAGGDSAS